MASQDDTPLDIAAVLDEYGIAYRDIQGEQGVRCPVHEDRVASASLNISKGLWHCHACGKGGDAINLISERELIPYASAVNRYKAITGTVGNPLRVRDGTREPRKETPPGSGYRPKFYRKLQIGLRGRTGAGS